MSPLPALWYVEPLRKTTMTGFEGKTQITCMVTLPADKEAVADAMFAKHKKWVSDTHANMGLQFYSVVKNKELKDPLDLENAEPTGRVIFTLTEIYATPEGLQKHWAAAPSSGFLDEFVGVMKAEGGTLSIMHGAPVLYGLGSSDLKWEVDPKA